MKTTISGAEFLNGDHLATLEGPMLDHYDTPRVRRGPDHLLPDPSNKPPAGPVTVSVKALEDAQDLLTKKLGRLEQLLGPVLSPIACAAAAGEPHPTPPQEAPLVESLRFITARIHGDRNLVEELIDRLAV